METPDDKPLKETFSVNSLRYRGEETEKGMVSCGLKSLDGKRFSKNNGQFMKPRRVWNRPDCQQVPPYKGISTGRFSRLKAHRVIFGVAFDRLHGMNKPRISW